MEMPNISSANYGLWEAFCNGAGTYFERLCTIENDTSDRDYLIAEDSNTIDGDVDLDAPSNRDNSTMRALNKAINLATVTQNERDFFISLLPKDLRDPTTLMRETVTLPICPKPEPNCRTRLNHVHRQRSPAS